MTDREKRAINLFKSYQNKLVYEISDKDKKAAKTLLNLIQKQDTEINSLKETIQKQEKSREHLKKQLKGQIAVKDTEINKLNNVIDRMAEVLSDFDFDKQCENCRCDYCNAVEDTDEYMECIKEYFMKEDK